MDNRIMLGFWFGAFIVALLYMLGHFIKLYWNKYLYDKTQFEKSLCSSCNIKLLEYKLKKERL